MTKLTLWDSNVLWAKDTLAPGAYIEADFTIIEPVENLLGLYSIDALTAEGWLRTLALVCDEHQRDELIRRLMSLQTPWRRHRESLLINFTEHDVGTSRGGHLGHANATSVGESAVPEVDELVLEPEAVLERIENSTTSPDDRITAVLFAEGLPFPDADKPRLVAALFNFVDQNRFAPSDELVTAVCAAIRKLALNMGPQDLEHYGDLFEPTSTQTLSCEIELELAKALGWRLLYFQESDPGTYPRLEVRVSDLASDYLITRLVLQQNYASIAAHAVIVVCLLNGSRQDELIDRVLSMNLDWFTDLVARRLQDAINKRSLANLGGSGRLNVLYERLVAATH